MRRTPFLAAVVAFGVTGCHASAPATSPTPLACRDFSAALTPFDTARVRDLVGTYELALVDTVSAPGRPSIRVGRLKLWAQDSVRSLKTPFGQLRAGRGFERPIAGSFTLTPPDTSQWGRRFASEDLDRPGVIWTTHHLRMGDYDILDGTGEDLAVRGVSATGFTGWWQSDLGIGIIRDRTGRLYKPGGYFCARRTG